MIKNYFQFQISILCHHVPGEPACKQISVSSTIPRHEGPFWSVLFRLSAISSKFSNEVLHVKFDLNILSQKCSDERKFFIESLQYLHRIMSDNGGNR